MVKWFDKEKITEQVATVKGKGNMIIQSGRDTYASMSKETLKIYKLYPEAHLPEYGTEWSACFDLRASIRSGDVIKYFMPSNRDGKYTVMSGSRAFTLYPGHQPVPTGLIFDLDQDQSMRVHPRSGLAIKQGISLINCEGVIDADYVQQTYITLYNTSDVPFEIEDGMRLAQAEIVKNNPVRFEVVEDQPQTKTDRTGGYGSTGTA